MLNLSEEERKRNELIQTNCDVFRISNTGRYKCTVEAGFLYQDVRNVFIVEPSYLQLDENETKELKVWAFPKETKVSTPQNSSSLF
jgi:hypothetical protein